MKKTNTRGRSRIREGGGGFNLVLNSDTYRQEKLSQVCTVRVGIICSLEYRGVRYGHSSNKILEDVHKNDQLKIIINLGENMYMSDIRNYRLTHVLKLSVTIHYLLSTSDSVYNVYMY